MHCWLHTQVRVLLLREGGQVREGCPEGGGGLAKGGQGVGGGIGG